MKVFSKLSHSSFKTLENLFENLRRVVTRVTQPDACPVRDMVGKSLSMIIPYKPVHVLSARQIFNLLSGLSTRLYDTARENHFTLKIQKYLENYIYIDDSRAKDKKKKYSVLFLVRSQASWTTYGLSAIHSCF